MRHLSLISVLFPVFNAAATLERAVDSIMRQSATDWELLLVDDGSRDDSLRILQGLAEREPRIRVISQAHAGIVQALNAGLREARGNLVARMDADDFSLPDRLRLQREFLDEHPEAGLVACRVRYEGEAARNAGYVRHVDWSNSLLTPEAISLNRFVESPFAHPSVMFRLTLVDEWGGYRDGPFPEDYELWLRWLEAGVTMAKVPETLLLWSDSPTRLSRADERYGAEAFYRVKAPYLARWLERHNPHHPRVMVWGAGRLTRRRSDLLKEHGVEITGYVDIDPAKLGRCHDGARVLAPAQMPEPGQTFILSFVGNVDARVEIAAWLESHGYRAGRDYLPAAG